MGRYCDGRGDGREANGEDTSELALSATSSPSPAPTIPYNQLCQDLASPTFPKARSPLPDYSSPTAHLPTPPEPSDSAVPAAKRFHIPVPAPPAKTPGKLPGPPAFAGADCSNHCRTDLPYQKLSNPQSQPLILTQKSA